jgi:DNA-binding MarR family transcriptional regulator
MSELQSKILQVIKEYLEWLGYAPTTIELGRELHYHRTTIAYHLRKLAKAGYIQRAPGVARGITLGPGK